MMIIIADADYQISEHVLCNGHIVIDLWSVALQEKINVYLFLIILVWVLLI